jgi:peptidoglycan L-alanyl-D-glutamate endopeptidase CwlK
MSRLISNLNLEVSKLCRDHIKNCQEEGIILLVYNTRRTLKDQALLYAQGRRIDELPIQVTRHIVNEIELWQQQGLVEVPGGIVTMTMKSNHLTGDAYDCVPMVDGKAVWDDDELWSKVGNIGKKLGLTWGGDWQTLRDRPHFELRKNE